MNDFRLKNMKKVFDIAKQEMFFYKSDIAVEEINEIMRENDNYKVYVGYYDLGGLYHDFQLNGDSDRALMDFSAEELIDYVVDYYNNLEQNLTACISITYTDKDGDYIEYGLEYNGYELFSDER